MKLCHLFISLVFIGASSCSTVYHSAAVLTPNLKEKGDMELQTGLKKETITSVGGSFNLGYSIALNNQYAALVNLEYMNESYEPLIEYISSLHASTMKGYSGEVYLGRYFATEKHNTSVYVGGGYGYQNKDFQSFHSIGNIAVYNTDYWKASILLQYSKNRDSRLKIVYFCRLNYLNYANTNLIHDAETVPSDLRPMKHFWNFEPGASLVLQFRKIDIFTQGIFSLSLNDYLHIESAKFYNNAVCISFGSKINLNYKTK